MKKFELFDHTADIGIKAYGKDLPELFSNAATGMFSLITDSKKVKKKEKFPVVVRGNNREQLMLNWLNELLFCFEIGEFLPKEFVILHIDDKSIQAEMHGQKYDSNQHEIEHEVKAATYHQLTIEKKTNWQASIIFDI